MTELNQCEPREIKVLGEHYRYTTVYPFDIKFDLQIKAALWNCFGSLWFCSLPKIILRTCTSHWSLLASERSTQPLVHTTPVTSCYFRTLLYHVLSSNDLHQSTNPIILHLAAYMCKLNFRLWWADFESTFFYWVYTLSFLILNKVLKPNTRLLTTPVIWFPLLQNVQRGLQSPTLHIINLFCIHAL